MKVLSIRQPWAWLIVNGHKDIENRAWPTKFRGQVLVHAGVAMPRGYYQSVALDCRQEFCIELPTIMSLERGGIVGIAEIVDCVTQSDSRWFDGSGYGFVIRNALPLPFTQMRGALGFFDTPADFVLPQQQREESANP